MSLHEIISRDLKMNGNNCSESLYYAFKDDLNLDIDFPSPRSIEGKCGALLTSLWILEKTGHSDKKDQFEKEFLKRFGYTKCLDLMSHERRCIDYVGVCASLLDDILGE